MNIKFNMKLSACITGIIIAMELCWLYALINLVNRQIANGQLNLLAVLLFLPLAFGFNKYLQRLAWHRTVLTLINWLAWAVVMLLVVKLTLFGIMSWTDPGWLLALPLSVSQLIYKLEPELVLLMSSAIIWWLGKWLAYRRVSFENTVAEFQFGLIMLLITFLVVSLLKLDIAGSIPVTMAFFFFSLLGISIAREGEGKSWLGSSGRVRWTWLLLLSIIVILVVGWLVSLVISHNLLQLVVDAIKWVGRLVLMVIAFIASLFPESGSSTVLPPGTEMPAMQPDQETMPFSIPEPLRSWLQAGMGFIWIGLIAVALWRISTQITNWLRKRWHSEGAEVESLRGGFRADLTRLFNAIWKGLSRLKSWARFLFRKKSKAQAFLSMQQVYNRLLRWGAGRGHPRQLWQTPDEYLQVLLKLLPQAHNELSYITQSYVVTRYGNMVPTSAELDDLKLSLKKVKQYSRKRK